MIERNVLWYMIEHAYTCSRQVGVGVKSSQESQVERREGSPESTRLIQYKADLNGWIGKQKTEWDVLLCSRMMLMKEEAREKASLKRASIYSLLVWRKLHLSIHS